MSKLSLLLAIPACSIGLLLAGCGDDDDATETVTEATELATATDTVAIEEACPDVKVDLGGVEVTVTDITTNAGCDDVQPLATDVLSRDDCVEESPSGSNECTSQSYTCTTTLPGTEDVTFVVSCEDGARHVEFSQAKL